MLLGEVLARVDQPVEEALALLFGALGQLLEVLLVDAGEQVVQLVLVLVLQVLVQLLLLGLVLVVELLLVLVDLVAVLGVGLRIGFDQLALLLRVGGLVVRSGDLAVLLVEVGGVPLGLFLVGLRQIFVVALFLLFVLLLQLLQRVGRIVLPLAVGVGIHDGDGADHLAPVRGAHLEAVELHRLGVADRLVLVFLGHRRLP